MRPHFVKVRKWRRRRSEVSRTDAQCEPTCAILRRPLPTLTIIPILSLVPEVPNIEGRAGRFGRYAFLASSACCWIGSRNRRTSRASTGGHGVSGQWFVGVCNSSASCGSQCSSAVEESCRPRSRADGRSEAPCEAASRSAAAGRSIHSTSLVLRRDHEGSAG